MIDDKLPVTVMPVLAGFVAGVTVVVRSVVPLREDRARTGRADAREIDRSAARACDAISSIPTIASLPITLVVMIRTWTSG